MDFSDSNSVFSASSATFLEEDFQLPDLEVNSTCNLENQLDEQRQRARINQLKSSINKEKSLLRAVDRLPRIPDSYFSKKKGVAARPERVVELRSSFGSKTELDVLKNSLCRNPGRVEETLEILEAIAEGTFEGDADEYAESTIDHPKLGSVEEKLEDLRQFSIEEWCARRGKVPNQKYTNSEKRMLRKWFRALDYDGSGEVNVEELQDPMLSSGILKTREQVVRVLANVDKNNTMGIDFEEFLLALGANKLADDSKLKKLQQMSSDPYFDADTLLTAERRNKLIKSVLRRCEERQATMDRLYRKYDKPKLTKKEREMFEIERERLEEEQSRSIYLHLKYIHALELVINDRKDFYDDQAAHIFEETDAKNRLTNNKDFYHHISDVRMKSTNREEAVNTLRALIPLDSPSHLSSSYQPNQSKFSAPGSVTEEKSFMSMATPSLGSSYLDCLKPIQKNSVEEFRLNPYKIYAPYSPTIKKINKSQLSSSKKATKR
jgi:hypothetical protein